jgi:putative tryptophan/tyrosine transport system substrate-binding protein
MRRREFIVGLRSAAAWPVVARAQQPAVPVVGYLDSKLAAAVSHQVAAFRHGLNEVGFVEGRNVAIEFRWADGQRDRLPDLAADLVQRRVAALVADAAATPAAKAATSTIPIVFVRRSDRSGLRHQPQPAGRQRHRCQLYHRPPEPQAPGTAA